MKRWQLFALIFIIGIVFVGFRYVHVTFEQYYKMLDNMSISEQDEEKIEERQSQSGPNAQDENHSKQLNTLWKDMFTSEKKWEPFILLLYGMDVREDSHDIGRPDTMMLALLDPEHTKLSLISLPRDSYVHIPGYKRHKLNTSFARGGVELTKLTIEEWLDISIDGYISIDFKGFEKLVDLLGGVEVYVDKDMRYQVHKEKSRIYLDQGRQVLKGKEALDFVRYRHNDHGVADTDYQRMSRQQQVLTEIGRELQSMRTLSRADEILSILGDHIKTTLSAEEINQLIIKYASFEVGSLDKTILTGEGVYEEGGWFEEIPIEEIERIKEMITQFMERK